MTNYVGISEGYHDAGVALINDSGNILFAGHSERYSKKKNDPHNVPEIWSDAMRYRDSEKLKCHFYERPWLKRLRHLYSGDFETAFEPRQVVTKLPMTTHGHHLSHAATAFQTSPYQRAAVVVVDAIGEWDTASIWYAYYDDKGYAKYQKMWSLKYPHSIGLFYTAMTDRVGLRPLEDEYVLMGMATYGNYTLTQKMYNDFIKDNKSLTFKQNMHRGCKNWAPYSPNENIAYATQRITEIMLTSLHEKAEQITGEANVCYAGGVALNCVFNSQLTDTWSNVWIPPNPGDCGSALGAAALGYGKQLNWKNAYLGYDIKGELDVNAVVDELLTYGMVGVANGRAEWGPRALGNRSLLANASTVDSKNRVNIIKQRQKYRPFAPAVLAEHADQFFELKPGVDYRYMQYAVKSKDITWLLYPAIMHIDGTARVQVVPKDGSNMRNILEAWYAKTKSPILLNTSLNTRHHPIVNDIDDAQLFEMMYGVRVVY